MQRTELSVHEEDERGTMTQINKLKIGLALNAIAMLSDEFTYDRIKGRLKEIEDIVAAEPETDDPEGGDYPDTIPNQFDNMTGSMNL